MLDKIKPLNGYALIEPLEKENITDDGIIIPDTVKQDRAQRGKVIAVSKTNITDNGAALPVEVKVGDEVLFGAFAGESIKMENLSEKEFRLVEIQFLRAVIK